jgi:spore germination cell wall hydrolase CwlJ-like protein
MTPQETLARTLWGEAGIDGKEGMQAVASVVLNRVKKPGWWGHDISSVCLAPWQFSCWLEEPVGEKNKILAVTDQDPQYQIALNLAQLALDGVLPDNTKGATLYYSPSAMPDGKVPSWVSASVFTTQVGRQLFYKN